MNDLMSVESLSAAGFHASPAAQQRFLEETAARRTARMELPVHRWMSFAAGGALSLAGAVLVLLRGDMSGLWVAGGAAVLHAISAGFSLRNRGSLSSPDGDPHPSACYRDERGTLRLRLEEGERVLHEADADGPVRTVPRLIAAAVQTSWGIVLGGIPVALLGGALVSKPALLLATVGTFLGTYVFGRGVMSLLGTKPVERVVLTDRRIAVLAAPGVAHSVPLDQLRYRPLVIGREAGKATVAITSRPLPATNPLSLPGLYGLHDVDEKTARAWAGDAMDARKKRVSR